MVSASIFLLIGLLGAITPVFSIKNPIYIISNAEQPSIFRRGLTPVGFKRANECLPALFSTLNIGKIIMCPQNDKSEVCYETLDTTQPIADALGLPIDSRCGASDDARDNCVNKLLHDFAQNSTQSILIVWDINAFDDLLGKDLDLNTDEAKADDGIHFDLVTIVTRGKIRGVVSQNCTDIDGTAPGTGTVKKRSLRRSKHKRSVKNHPSLPAA